MFVVYLGGLAFLAVFVAHCDVSTVGRHHVARLQCDFLCRRTEDCVAYTYEKSDVLCFLEIDKNKARNVTRKKIYKDNGKCRCAAYSKWHQTSRKQSGCSVCLDNDRVKHGTCFCRRKWSYYDNSCYNSYSKKVTWNRAVSLCKKKRAYLAEISSREEHRFVRRVVRKRKHELKKVWIAASDDAKEGEWIWRRSGERVSDLQWCKGQPDNGIPLLKQNCLTLSAKSDLRCNWNLDDDTCFLQYYVLCEAKAKCVNPC